MIGNIKLHDKIFDFVEKHSKETIIVVGTGVLIAGIILSSSNSKPKEYFPYAPRPVGKIVEEYIPEKVDVSNKMTRYIEVGLNQIMRLEPRSDSKYVDKIENIKEAELLYIDGEHALISYTDTNGMTKLGYILTSGIAHLKDVGSIYQATKVNKYGEIKNDKREGFL